MRLTFLQGTVDKFQRTVSKPQVASAHPNALKIAIASRSSRISALPLCLAAQAPVTFG
jgi:hypothetical protein